MRAKRGKGVRPLRGTVEVPGDKSITHRALILASLADGTSTVRGANPGADATATLACLRALGATSTAPALNGELHVEGWGAGGGTEPASVLDAGNSGTTLRLLAAVCSTISGHSVLTGDETLRRRPMMRVVEPLRAMGARIDGRADGDRAPLSIRGGRLVPVDWTLPVASAQVKSALLLAALRTEGPVTVREPGGSRDHTEIMLEHTGVRLQREQGSITLHGPQVPEAATFTIPGDISAALFLITAALLAPGSDLQISGVGLNPTRTAALEVLARMGGTIEVEHVAHASGEPCGRVRAVAGPLQATEVAPHEVPRLIDEVPILAVAATQAEGTTWFRGVGELRVKESNRMEALHEELTKIGADVEVAGDTLAVTGPTPLRAAAVDSRGDHRIALALAVAGIATGVNVRVQGWSATNTSFPGFIELVRRAQVGKA